MSHTLARRALSLTAAALAVTAVAACSSTPKPAESKAKNDDTAAVTAAAGQYMKAWMDTPSQPKTMCELETAVARPNHAEDGGTLEGCIKDYESFFAGQSPRSGALTIEITNVQDVKAHGTQPAGKGALATMKRVGADAPVRYVLRLVADAGTWRVAQSVEAPASRYGHTADPVADALEKAV
ncbi:hypothetical protein AB0N09_30890 [Streptomyces erythrochromogenes]|uniref:hypothetical protein n=1 Tax=Streptomyces erythrochromogenes TaxID=285574 RepID=UPI00342A96DE